MIYLEAYLNQISEKFRLTSVAARAGSQDARGEFEQVWPFVFYYVNELSGCSSSNGDRKRNW